MSDGTRADARIPNGAKDVLPVEIAELRAIEQRWRAHVQAAGYREVRTPILEYARVIDRAQADASGEAYRLFDDDGSVLVLRPDLTIPVARLVATRMADHPGPVRVSYIAGAFHPPRLGRPRPGEVRQAGIELVGASRPGADAEVIALLAGSLQAAGVRAPRINVGDVSLTRAVMDALDIDAPLRAALGTALAERDLVNWRDRVNAALPAGTTRELLAELPALRGDTQLLERIRTALPAVAPACDALADTIELAQRHGHGVHVSIDLGALRDWSYYSGIVLEAYGPGASEPLAVGGRYDALGARFGTPRSAVGFAIALDQVHRAVLAAAPAERLPNDGIVLVGGLDTHIEQAAAARAAGIAVIALAADDAQRAEPLAQADNWRHVVWPQPNGDFVALDRLDGSRRTVAVLQEVVG